MYVCLTFPCMRCDRLSRCTTYVLLRKSNDSWCCDTHSNWSPFSRFVTESYYFAREMADMHFMYGRANGNSREVRHLYVGHYPQRRIPSHKLFTKLHQWLSECSFPYCILQCYSSAQSNAKLPHISAGIDVWTYVSPANSHSTECFILNYHLGLVHAKWTQSHSIPSN
jgi:hypothetical protein